MQKNTSGTCVDYVLEVSSLLDVCCRRLSLVGPRDDNLSDLALYLATTERQIHEYVIAILQSAGEAARPHIDDSSLMVTCARLATLRSTLNSDVKFTAAFKTGGVNSLLFYLINTLQLCLTRIEDADRILCGQNASRTRSRSLQTEMGNDGAGVLGSSFLNGTDMYIADPKTLIITGTAGKLARRQQITNTIFRWTRRTALSLGVGGLMFLALDRKKKINSKKNQEHVAKRVGWIVGFVFLRSLAKRKYEVWRLRQRLNDSTQSLSMWQQKWIIVSSIVANNDLRKTLSYNKLIAEPCAEDHNLEMKASSRRLLESLPIRSNKGAFWYSQGAFRLLMVRRAMDLVYASVGTAMDFTGPNGAYGLWMPVAGLCASYYAIAGPDVTSTRAAYHVTAPSMDFIKRAWGMVTMPPVKWLSMEASRLFKGINVIERVFIAGVPCLLLSHGPQPAIIAALDRSKRQKGRTDDVLPDIEEGLEGSSSPPTPKDRKSRSPKRDKRDKIAPKVNKDLSNLEEKDVIFHITGGGWFIHTTATDIPWLAEWSAVSDAVVVVPEYDLLPEHHYPRALNQCTSIYSALVSGEAATDLGFRTKKIAVTGESAGGNLAAAMIVKLCMENIVDKTEVNNLRDKQRSEEEEEKRALAKELLEHEEKVEKLEDEEEKEAETEKVEATMKRTASSSENFFRRLPSNISKEARKVGVVTLPDCLMLSCPALNMCHSVSPSRIMGTGDPVLPSGLIQMISNEYVPDSSGVSKEDPYCSPYFAPDDVLRCFPNTLLWVSAVDPLLDDAVDFNTRLRRVGVNSSIHAAQHMPHAFLGLSNAGFPEAERVQKSCQRFIIETFRD
mmetsp:Transcript_13960/g.25587  ORF Transcript_13960/g.25587 Transcript_13960/m.25587 type:complete len:840 (-) Transcript_13960:95-2614(-)